MKYSTIHDFVKIVSTLEIERNMTVSTEAIMSNMVIDVICECISFVRVATRQVCLL